MMPTLMMGTSHLRCHNAGAEIQMPKAHILGGDHSDMVLRPRRTTKVAQTHSNYPHFENRLALNKSRDPFARVRSLRPM